jgi:hypothetical protein
MSRKWHAARRDAPVPSAPASVPYGPAGPAPLTASGSSDHAALKTAAGIGFRIALPFIIRGVFRALSRG